MNETETPLSAPPGADVQDLAAATTKPAGLPLMDPEEWRQKHAAHVFRSPESFRWFTRQHRDELVRDGVILAPSGRHMVHVERIEAAVINIGTRLAETLRR